MEELEIIELEFTSDELATMQEIDSLPIAVAYGGLSKPSLHRRY